MEKIKHIKKILTAQQDETDCGAACLLSIIRFYGGEGSIENIRKLSGTNITGTTLLGLYQAAAQLGFDTEGCQSSIEVLAGYKFPCVLYVRPNHYVVCYGATRNAGRQQFIIGDPAKGLVYWSQEELDEAWPTKKCLELVPNRHFKYASSLRRQKRQWIKQMVGEDLNILIIAAVLGLGIAFLGLIMAVFSQRLIDEILPKKSFTKLNLGVAVVLLLLIAREGLSYIRLHFLLRQSKEFNVRITRFFYDHLLHLPKSFFDTRKIGDLTARLNDTSRIQRVISQIAGNIIIDALIGVVTLVFLFIYSQKVGLICITALPFYFLLLFKQRHKISIAQRSIMSNYAASEANYISTLQGIETIKHHNKQSLFTVHNTDVYGRYQEESFKLGKIQISLTFMANAFGIFFLLGILLLTSYQVLHGTLKAGELMAILGMSSTLLPSIANLALFSIPLNEAKIAFARMFEFTEMEPEAPKKIAYPVDITQINSIALRGVSFRFPGRSEILKNISFCVKKGEIIGIIGENGCGKSTLTGILSKTYLPERGRIYINDSIDLPAIPMDLWRGQIGVVPQNIHIFNTTVLENIGFDDAKDQPQKVLEFLQRYGFDRFIDALPQSYMTLVGEEGINLSGGQKQVIGLARALYHGPQLLVLDEATAAMDRENEQFVLNLLLRLKRDMAVIFITHRIHVLRVFCDQIHVMVNGITENNGSHEQLLETKNLYSAYWADLIQ